MSTQHTLLAFDLGETLKLNETQSVGGSSGVFNSPAKLINIIVPNLFIGAGLVMFFLLIAGGVGIITAGGEDQLNKNKKQIGFAIAGFLIIFASFWIIQIIETVMGVKILNPQL